MKVIISGKAETDCLNLKELDGIDCQDNFTDYFDGDFAHKLGSGYLQFEVVDDVLYSVTEYSVKEKLTADELKELGEYTQGQWSDGIGEGFEQQPCCEVDGEEVYISAWYWGQELTITQE